MRQARKWFRILIATNIALMVLTCILTLCNPQEISSEEAKALFGSTEPSLAANVFSFGAVLAPLLLWLLSHILLFVLWRQARLLYTATCVALYLVLPVVLAYAHGEHLSLTHSDQALDLVGNIAVFLSGAILAMTYLPPLSSQFRKLTAEGDHNRAATYGDRLAAFLDAQAEKEPRGCHFCFLVRAPQGLNALSTAFEESSLNLRTCRSRYSGMDILRSCHPGPIDLDMDSQNTTHLWGEGLIESDFTKAKEIVEELGRVFASGEYPHSILVDSEDETGTHRVEYEWNDEHERESRT